MADDKKFTEDAYEQTLIALFRDELGYAYECGYEVERDYKEPFYRADLVASMRRLNPELPADAMDEGIKQITNISIGTLEQNNEQFTLWMQKRSGGGIPAEWRRTNSPDAAHRLRPSRKKSLQGGEPVAGRRV